MSGPGQETVCHATGLALLPCSGQSVWRIQKPSYGPLNPPPRRDREDRGEWGRWDTAGALTIYMGASPVGSYVETLAWAKPAELNTVGATFPDDGPDATSLMDQVALEWADRGHLPPGSVPAAWREARRLYELTLPTNGWLVDLRVSASLAAMNKSAELMSTLTPMLSGQELILGDLSGRDRELTTRVAEWIHRRTLEDGQLPHGIVYSSKWGNDLPCFAIWLREMAAGAEEQAEPTKRAIPLAGKPISADDPDLREAAAKLNVIIG